MRTHIRRALLAAVVAIVGIGSAHAQYFEIANQLPNLIAPALSGSGRYKGFVEVSGLAGVGDARATFVGVSTTQGYQYSDWFFMGAGIGVDVAMARNSFINSANPEVPSQGWYTHSLATTKAMIPIFSDFRFNLGSRKSTSFYIDLKLGAAWLLGSSYLAMDGGYVGNSTQFYFRPSVGVRIPSSSTNNRQAFNIGLTYQLLTSNNSYGWADSSATLSNIGITLGYEW